MRKDEPLSNQCREIELGTLDRDIQGVEVVRYEAPILLIKPLGEDGALLDKANVQFEYSEGKGPWKGGGQFVQGKDVHCEKQPDGFRRTEQLLSDEEFTVTVEAEGYESKSEKLKLPEGAVRELEVKLKPVTSKANDPSGKTSVEKPAEPLAEPETKSGLSGGAAAAAAKQPDSQQPAKALAAGGANGQAAAASAGRSESDESEWFHLVRMEATADAQGRFGFGASTAFSTSWPDGAVESPIMYSDFNQNLWMGWIDRGVVLQPGDRDGPTWMDVPADKMLMQPSTQRELKLTAEQKKKLREISARYWPERQKIAEQDLAKRGSKSGKKNEEPAAKATKAWKAANQPAETAKFTASFNLDGTGSQGPMFSKETVARLESQWRDTRKQIEDVLTPDQLTVLKDLTFRTLAFGSGIISHPLVVGKLGLTTKQQEELKQLTLQLQQEKNRRLAQIARDKIAKILAVLTPQQLAELHKRYALPDFELPYPALPSRDTDGAADELGLSAAQRAHVRDMMDKYWKAISEIDKERAKLSLDDEAGLKAIGEKAWRLVAELHRQVEAALTPQQMAMLKEMEFQNIVGSALHLPAAPENVAGNNQEKPFLNEQQKATLRQIDNEFSDKPEQVYCELTAKALKLFTPAQQAILRAEVDRRGW